jgi:hypothetical protein
MMPISNSVSGCVKHRIWGRCAKVETPEKPHFQLLLGDCSTKKAAHISSPFSFQLFQVFLREWFLLLYMMGRMGKNGS